MRNKSTSAESVFNHPGREIRIVNISKSAIPATPPSKGGESFVANAPFEGYACGGVIISGGSHSDFL